MPRRLVAVEIDPDKCVGSAMCIGVDPGSFRLGPEGRAQCGPATPDVDLAEEAAELCPMAAIRLVYEEER